MEGVRKDLPNYLDGGQLQSLENNFQSWAQSPKRNDVRLSRQRILIIFLLIRYTGAKLNEVLSLSPTIDIDFPSRQITFQADREETTSSARSVHIAKEFANELEEVLHRPEHAPLLASLFVDPAFVRRKFYDRALECGFDKQLGGPEMIRRARAAELMRGNLPMPAVQEMLGQSTANLTSAYVTFSSKEIDQVTRIYIDREARRKTSARNSFFGKICKIQRGNIQAAITLSTPGGNTITTMITIHSLENLGLQKGQLITAEVKAPWITLQRSAEKPSCSADNVLSGTIQSINRGTVSSEYVVKIGDGTSLCAIISSESGQNLALRQGDSVWALFNCYGVVLHQDQ